MQRIERMGNRTNSLTPFNVRIRHTSWHSMSHLSHSLKTKYLLAVTTHRNQVWFSWSCVVQHPGRDTIQRLIDCWFRVGARPKGQFLRRPEGKPSATIFINRDDFIWRSPHSKTNKTTEPEVTSITISYTPNETTRLLLRQICIPSTFAPLINKGNGIIDKFLFSHTVTFIRKTSTKRRRSSTFWQKSSVTGDCRVDWNVG